MKLLIKTPVAIIIMLAAIAAASVFGGAWSLSRERSDIIAAFDDKEDPDSTQYEVDYIAHNINMLISFCDSPDIVSQSYVDAAGEALEALKAAEGADAKMDALWQATQAAYALYNAIDLESLGTVEQSFIEPLANDIGEAMARIYTGEYSDRVDEFNDALGKFPARLMSELFGVEPIRLFEGHDE